MNLMNEIESFVNSGADAAVSPMELVRAVTPTSCFTAVEAGAHLAVTTGEDDAVRAANAQGARVTNVGRPPGPGVTSLTLPAGLSATPSFSELMNARVAAA